MELLLQHPQHRGLSSSWALPRCSQRAPRSSSTTYRPRSTEMLRSHQGQPSSSQEGGRVDLGAL